MYLIKLNRFNDIVIKFCKFEYMVLKAETAAIRITTKTLKLWKKLKEFDELNQISLNTYLVYLFLFNNAEKQWMNYINVFWYIIIPSPSHTTLHCELE